MGYSDYFGLEKITLFHRNDFRGWAFDKVPDKKGVCIVMGHGNSQQMQDDRSGKSNRVSLDPQTFNELINNNGCSQEMPVELLACNTAEGEDSFAEKLSKLRDTQVTGADSYVQFLPDGRVKPVVRLPYFTFIPTGVSGRWVTHGK